MRSAVGDTAEDMDEDAGMTQASAVRASTRVTEDGTRSTGRRAKGPGVRSSQGLGTGRGPKGKGG